MRFKSNRGWRSESRYGADDSDDDNEDERNGYENGVSASVGSTTLGLRPGAILNLAADTVHNFMDGLSIAASWCTGNGVATTVGIFFHEIPHEVGDFAILLQQGFTKRGAFLAQFVSAIGAFMGCGVGLYLSAREPASVLAFTAGGFIYISLVDVMPELLHGPLSFGSALVETLAFASGVGMMVMIGIHEESMMAGGDMHTSETLDASTALNAMLATLAITLGGNLCICIFFCVRMTPVLEKTMLSFAIGALLGDAFLHMIPHALHPH